VIAEITAENRDQKWALGLVDHGQLPGELHDLVEQAKRRSFWRVRRSLKQLGVSSPTYYCWHGEAG
jgi:hypothetical protein